MLMLKILYLQACFPQSFPLEGWCPVSYLPPVVLLFWPRCIDLLVAWAWTTLFILPLSWQHSSITGSVILSGTAQHNPTTTPGHPLSGPPTVLIPLLLLVPPSLHAYFPLLFLESIFLLLFPFQNPALRAELFWQLRGYLGSVQQNPRLGLGSATTETSDHSWLMVPGLTKSNYFKASSRDFLGP